MYSCVYTLMYMHMDHTYEWAYTLKHMHMHQMCIHPVIIYTHGSWYIHINLHKIIIHMNVYQIYVWICSIYIDHHLPYKRPVTNEKQKLVCPRHVRKTIHTHMDYIYFWWQYPYASNTLMGVCINVHARGLYIWLRTYIEAYAHVPHMYTSCNNTPMDHNIYT